MNKQLVYLIGASLLTMPLFTSAKNAVDDPSVVKQEPNTSAQASATDKQQDQQTTSQEIKHHLYPINRIEVVIYGKDTTEIITTRDINRVSFEGVSRSKDDVILERLMFQDALRHKIVIDEKVIDEYIAKMCKQYNATIDDIKLMFEQAGYTFDEGRKQFGVMYGVNQMVNHKIRDRMMVPEKDVLEYYQANPIIKPATYILERAVVTYPRNRKEEIRKKIDTYIETGHGLAVGWHQLPEIAESDLAEDKKFIMQLPIGQISEPREIEGGFELFRVKSKQEAHLMPLEERYREIVDILRRPKYEELLKQYQNELMQNASIVYL